MVMVGVAVVTVNANHREALSNQQTLAYGSYIEDLTQLHELLWNNVWWTPDDLTAQPTESDTKAKNVAITAFWDAAQSTMGKAGADSARSWMVANQSVRRTLGDIDDQRDKTLLDFKCATGIQEDGCNPNENPDHRQVNRSALRSLVNRDTETLLGFIKTLKDNPHLGESQ